MRAEKRKVFELCPSINWPMRLSNTVQWYNFSRDPLCEHSPIYAQETQTVELALLDGENLVEPLGLLVRAVGAHDWIDDNLFPVSYVLIGCLRFSRSISPDRVESFAPPHPSC